MISKNYKIYNKSCYGLSELENESIDALITDPPYGVSLIKIIIGIKTYQKERSGKIP